MSHLLTYEHAKQIADERASAAERQRVRRSEPRVDAPLWRPTAVAQCLVRRFLRGPLDT